MNPAASPHSLDQLRELHLPGNAAGAIQGEIVVAIALGFAAALIVGVVRYLRVRARTTLKRSALRELEAANALEPVEARRVAQARLLRRLVRTMQGDEAASLKGKDWATRLDSLFKTDLFSRGAGTVLVEGLYGRPTASDASELDAELRRLIGRIGR